jgi:hypothetical protein
VGTDSQIIMTLSQNQTVRIVVDGYDGDEGSFTLHIQSVVCPAGSLIGAVPQTVSGSTVTQPNFISPSCGAPGSPEATYSFTAPSNATYTFDTIGSNFDTVLHIHNGNCFGPELGCDDDTVMLQSVVSLPLTAGQTVVIAVDGFGGDEGNYTLNIN